MTTPATTKLGVPSGLGLSSAAATLDNVNSMISGFDREPLHTFQVNIPWPSLMSSNMEFYVSVSWMYVLIFEEGRIGINFLLSRVKAFELDPDGSVEAFPKLAHALRTRFQHGLDFHSMPDTEKLFLTSGWMAKTCGEQERPGHYFWPESEIHWRKLAQEFCSRAADFIDALAKSLMKIENDEFRNDILDAWERRETATMKPYEFDSIILECSKELGLPAVDAKRFRVKYYDKWRGHLTFITGGEDLILVARKLVSSSLLEHWGEFCPVTGQDIIDRFDLEPGPEVGALIRTAKRLWKDDPCDQQQLLERLSQAM